jgi:hypothetical protein
LDGGVAIEGDDKHSNLLLKEWGLVECKAMNTILPKDVEIKVSSGELVSENDARKAQRAMPCSTTWLKIGPIFLPPVKCSRHAWPSPMRAQ